MFPILIKLKKANTLARLIHFSVLLSWHNLFSEITNIFQIPLKEISVTYTDSKTLCNNQDLHHFSKSLQPFEKIKFVIQNLQTPDTESAFISQTAPTKIVGLKSVEYV